MDYLFVIKEKILHPQHTVQQPNESVTYFCFHFFHCRDLFSFGDYSKRLTATTTTIEITTTKTTTASGTIQTTTTAPLKNIFNSIKEIT